MSQPFSFRSIYLLLRGPGEGDNDVELLAVKIRLIVSRENPENSNLGEVRWGQRTEDG